MKKSCERVPSLSWAVLVLAIAACASAPEPRVSGVVGAESADSPPHGDSERSPNDVEVQVARELDRLIAEGGTQVSIVVLDPRDGRILAAEARSSGSNPFDDANDANPANPANQANDPNDAASAIERVVSTGSTLKTLTLAAALEAGLDPARRFDGEGGEWRAEGDTVLRDHEPHVSLDAREVLMTSSNVGAAKIVRAVGDEVVLRYLRDAGARLDDAHAAMELGAGIGTSMRLVDLATAYVVFANGGRAIEPTRSGDGPSRAVISPATATTILTMLEAATSEEGTGHPARVEGHRVGGKTGTTRDGAAVFVGIAPIDAPRFVIAVRVERPDGAWGGSVAAPSFARLASALLDGRSTPTSVD